MSAATNGKHGPVLDLALSPARKAGQPPSFKLAEVFESMDPLTQKIVAFGAGLFIGLFLRRKKTGPYYAHSIKLSSTQLEQVKQLAQPSSHARRVRRQMRRCNLRRLQMWFSPASSSLFVTFEYTGKNLAKDLDRMGNEGRVGEWWQQLEQVQVPDKWGSMAPSKGGSYTEWWSTCECVFAQETPAAKLRGIGNTGATSAKSDSQNMGNKIGERTSVRVLAPGGTGLALLLGAPSSHDKYDVRH